MSIWYFLTKAFIYLFVMFLFGLLAVGGYLYTSTDLSVGFWTAAIGVFGLGLMLALVIQGLFGEPLARVGRKIADRAEALWSSVVGNGYLQECHDFVVDVCNLREPGFLFKASALAIMFTISGVVIRSSVGIGNLLFTIGVITLAIILGIIVGYILSRLHDKFCLWFNEHVARRLPRRH